ncbi:MAG: sugar phosphate isomerase/epimerase family protein [Bacillota bacterium]
MKFGVCSKIENAQIVADAGFDYIEPFLTDLALADEATYQQMVGALNKSGLRLDVACLFLPGTFRLTGPDADLLPVEAYLKTCFDRAAALGTKIQVFGSGGARNVPEGFSKEKATEQLVKFLKLAAKYAAKYEIKIAIEPLCKKECNIINSVAEAHELAIKVDLPNVGVLADWYHMGNDNEGVAGLIAAKDMLLHCHIARLIHRTPPMLSDDDDYSMFFNALKEIGYNGALSVESNGGLDLISESLKLFKEFL